MIYKKTNILLFGAILFFALGISVVFILCEEKSQIQALQSYTVSDIGGITDLADNSISAAIPSTADIEFSVVLFDDGIVLHNKSELPLSCIVNNEEYLCKSKDISVARIGSSPSYYIRVEIKN